MKTKWLGLCLVFFMTGAVIASVASAAPAASINKIVVFGDSLSDTGNLYEYMRHQLPMSPPYYEGRFTNGPVWIEHVLTHYFPSNPKLHLSNYAFGGSGVGSEGENDEDDIGDGAMLNLDAEVSSYLLAHDDKTDASSLYVVWMGSNNYLSLPEDLDDEVEFTLAGIRRSLDTLVQKGAKNIMVMGVPDLGKTPMALEFESTDDLTYLSHQHNTKLKAEVEQLRALHPDVQWVFFDVDVLLTDALTQPALYGFSNVTGTCYDALDYLPSSQSVLNMASRIKPGVHPEDVCDTYLFFDPVHPSSRAHAYIAERGIELLDKLGMQFG
ncbi:MAG: SGNH/GDSL hydrolase family protein [Legionella sp.]|nr:SGNH/GDSL hydrolase family protein [Legionella sp.]